MVTITTPNFTAQVFDDGQVSIKPAHSKSALVNCKLVDLVYVVMQAQDAGIPLKVATDFSQWRGYYGTPE
jgi:hypothetical protein